MEPSFQSGSFLPTLVGERVILRLPVPADVAARVEIPRDPEEDRMYGGLGEAKTFTTAEVDSGFAEMLRQDLSTVRNFRIAARIWPDGRPIDEPNGRLIGGIRLHGIAWPDRHARLAIGIFDRRFWSHSTSGSRVSIAAPGLVQRNNVAQHECEETRACRDDEQVKKLVIAKHPRPEDRTFQAVRDCTKRIQNASR